VIHFFGLLGAAPPGEYDLGEDAAHHANVRRLETGDAITVLNGLGFRSIGEIVSLTKKKLVVRVDRSWNEPEPPPIHLYVPVADRERMLWLAEKAAELQVSSWTPVMFHRSKSVSPRGDGEAFTTKVVARMKGAMEQSGASWLPMVCPTIPFDHLRTPDGQSSIVLDRGGEPFLNHPSVMTGLAIAVGPEGGLEPEEIEMLRERRWRTASIGNTTLRFETAAIAALAIARASLPR
jgi:16S rRNA (uracil1498-N3)-methyltransferase